MKAIVDRRLRDLHAQCVSSGPDRFQPTDDEEREYDD